MARLLFVILGFLIVSQYATANEERGKYAVEEILDESPFEELTDVKDVIFAIKSQVKDIIEEVLLHVLDYVKGMLHHLKVKLLKKLAKWTLSDVFHAVFDGVTEFVIDTEPVIYEEYKKPKPFVHVEEYHQPALHIKPQYFYPYLGRDNTDQ